MIKKIKYIMLITGLFLLNIPVASAATQLECQYQMSEKELVELKQNTNGKITLKYFSDYTKDKQAGSLITEEDRHFYLESGSNYTEVTSYDSCPSYMTYIKNIFSRKFYFANFSLYKYEDLSSKISSKTSIFGSQYTAYLSYSNGIDVVTSPCSSINWTSKLAELQAKHSDDNPQNICLYGYDNGKGSCDTVQLVYGNSELMEFSASVGGISTAITGEKLKPYRGICPEIYRRTDTGFDGEKVPIGEDIKIYSYYLNSKDGNERFNLYKSIDTKTITLHEKQQVNSCEELISATMIAKLNEYMTILRIAVPIIIIILGTIDFASAVLAADDDKMKKAQSRFVKRLIIGLLIFFIPTFVKLLLKIANAAWGTIGTGTCGIS